MRAALLVYALGVLVGLVATDERPLPRLGLALLWPLGPLAFLVTIATLVLAAPIAFPIASVVLVVAAATVWWLVR